jgi:cytochrome c-type biogenesis protein CcsB
MNLLRLALLPCLLAATLSCQAADPALLDYSEWGKIAILEGGRLKPVETFSAESLRRMSGLKEVTTEGRTWSPNEFVLSMLLEDRDWEAEPLILVDYHPLSKAIGLDDKQKRFSFTSLAAATKLGELADEARQIRAKEQKPDRLHQEAEHVLSRLHLFASVRGGTGFFIIPPPPGPPNGTAWLLAIDAQPAYTAAQFAPVQEKLQGMAGAFVKRDSATFNARAGELRTALRALNPRAYPSEEILTLEYRYDRFDPFHWAMLAYATGFLLIVAYGMGAQKLLLLRAALGFALLGVAIHATGITMRCLIAGRPPVTNMYESVIWVSLAVAVFGLIFYARYRTPLYLGVCLTLPALALLLVQQVPVALSPSIDPLVPVLRDNFWLTIHVLTITLSYGAFLLAWGFGHVVLWRYLIDPQTTKKDVTLHFWLYRIIQLGVILVAAGTILGGVWANYSWGRFWGWDPKETWALITLLSYIFVIHGRMAGWWGPFGLAVASVLCFLSVLMCWYGVNFVLGTGLHSYGFGLGGESYVTAFIALDLLFVVFTFWRKQTAATA